MKKKLIVIAVILLAALLIFLFSTSIEGNRENRTEYKEPYDGTKIDWREEEITIIVGESNQ